MEFQTNIFQQFRENWALVTAGDRENFNTMTISWGGLGTIWNKSVATVYVRTSRYTHEFMDTNEYFTVSFYPSEYKKILGVLGAKSGREMDKKNASGLTPRFLSNSVTFEEAKVTLLCRKLFRQEIKMENIPEDVKATFYSEDAPHDMYIGEVVDIIQ